MNERSTSTSSAMRFRPSEGYRELLREGVQRLLACAIEVEVDDYIGRHLHLRDAQGARLVVRNGYLPARELSSSLGSISVRVPRVNDRRVDASGQRRRFTSQIVPPYLRDTSSIVEFMPWLYTKGFSTGDFSEALWALMGAQKAPLPSAILDRLKQIWREEHIAWQSRSLANTTYDYLWIDAIPFNITPEDNEPCILVVLAADGEGRPELVAAQKAISEDEQSWRDLLLGLRTRGLTSAPKLAVGDSTLRFWPALERVYASTGHQHCLDRTTSEVIAALPGDMRPRASQMLEAAWEAPSKSEADRAFDRFLGTYASRLTALASRLAQGRSALLKYYDFDAAYRTEIRSTRILKAVRWRSLCRS